MAYNTFTNEKIIEQFGITFQYDIARFECKEPKYPSDLLKRILERNIPYALNIGTEKAKSEFIVVPILTELVEMTGKTIGLYSGKSFNVDSKKGLNGICDFIISKNNQPLVISAPVLAVVEAKKNDLDDSIGQCAAEMIASKIFNDKHELNLQNIYGVVTTGLEWRFLQLIDNKLFIQQKSYEIENPEIILGVLYKMVTD